MKISRVAVVVLALVWAVILLVPPLNYYFRLQVYNASERDAALAILPPPENSPDFWQKAARRFPNNRDVLYQAALERPIGDMEGAIYSYDWPFGPLPTNSQQSPSSLFPGRLAADVRHERVRRIELLRRKFPQDTFLIVAEIRARLASFSHERIGGELVDVMPTEERPKGYVSPEKNGEKVNFTPVDFEKAIALCRMGQKLEPENGYFNWMECYFLMHSWRDGEALKALEVVGRKKHYNDYVLEEIRVEVNALSIAWGRPLLYEEKTGPVASSQYAQFARQRELARVISWQAIKAQRRGDHAEAIRIAAALGRVGAKIRDHSYSYISGLVGMWIEAIGWYSLTHDWHSKLPKTLGREVQKKRRHKALQAYLVEHGQQTIVAEVTQSEVTNANFISQKNASDRALGPTYSGAFTVILLWVSGIKLLLLLIMPLLVLILMTLAKHIAPVWGWLRWDESDVTEIPSVDEVWHGVLACMGWRAWTIALCGFLIVSVTEVLFLGGLSTYLKQLQEIPFLKVLLENGTTPISSNLWLRFYFSLLEVSYMESPWRIAVFCVPILFGTLYFVWRAVEWQKRRNGEVSAWLSIGRVVDFVIMLVLVWSFFVQVFAENTPEYFTTRLILALVTFVCAAVLLGEKFLTWRKRPQRRATVRYGLRLLQRSLFSWLMVGSVIYLLTLVATTIVRHRADIEIDRVVAMGEVKAAQERGE